MIAYRGSTHCRGGWLAATLLILAPAPAAAQQPETDIGRAIARGRVAMREAMSAGAAPGSAVAVAVNGRLVWSEGFGRADIARGIPITTATRFGIGSISKALTLAAALSLADAGLVDLDAPVERYLPDFPHRGRGVTLRRIGVHQSGISDTFADEHYYTTTHYASLAEVYPAIARGALMFEPGSRTAYATGLFTIVGRVLEVVAGESYLDLMRHRVLQPAGMRATEPNDPRHSSAGAHRVLRLTGRGRVHPRTGLRSEPEAAWGRVSLDRGDVARFGAALLRPGLLSAGARREMFTPVSLTDGTPGIYALGFQSLREDGRRLLLQPGGGPGIAGWLAIYPDDDVVVAILSNATGAPLGGDVRRAVAAGFLRPPAPAPSPRPQPAPPP